MKKFLQVVFFVIAAIVVLSLILPAFASAKDLSSVKIGFSADTNKACYQPTGYDPVRGCYIAGENKIILQSDLPRQLLPYIFLRLLGHYVIHDATDAELSPVFRPTPDKAKMTNIREFAADVFSVWILGGRTSPEQSEFFSKQLSR